MADDETGALALPGQLPRLTHDELVRAQAETLGAPRRRYGVAARALFVLLDLIYGKARTLNKFTGHCCVGQARGVRGCRPSVVLGQIAWASSSKPAATRRCRFRASTPSS